MAKNTMTFKTIARLSPLLLAGFFAASVSVSVAWASSISSSDVIKLANDARTEAGLAPLAENQKLAQAAKKKAEDMLKNDYFAHTSPDGVTPWSWIKGAGYQYRAAGENLAINYTSAKDQHKAWMKSPSHRANIMNAQYREIGVATVKGKIDGKESVVTVEFFGTPLSAVADKQAPVPPVAQKAPAEIKGMETQVATGAPLSDIPTVQQVLQNTQNIAPVSSENIVPVPQKSVATAPAGKMPWLDISWLAFIAILGFSLIAPVAAFLFRAYASLATAVKAKNTEMTEAIETIQTGKPSLLEHHLRI